MRTRRNKAEDTLPPAGDRQDPSAAADEIAGVPAGDGRWEIAGRARGVRLAAGLHALVVGKSDPRPDDIAGATLPLTQIVPRIDDRAAISVVPHAAGDDGWLGPEGGTVVLRVSDRGGTVLVTTYGITNDAALPVLKLLDLGRLNAGDTAAPAAASPPGREIPNELILHIERQGDRRFPAGGWAGNPGARLRVEGFGIRPLQAIAPGQIEYMAFGPGGRQTPWVSDAKLCGTRGRGFPLTGFAVRLVPPLRERFDVLYEGYFFDSGIRGPVRNGDPCLPSIVDDPLGAIRLRVVERTGA